MRLLIPLALSAALSLSAAVNGIVTNQSTGKPQPGATITLFQTSQAGPQFVESVKTDAQGKFAFTRDVNSGVGGGPLLIQAVSGGVQYNKMLPPGTPTTGVEIPVYETAKKVPEATLEQHMIVLEPSPSGTMQVNETYMFRNTGKVTWNDPDAGTLQFALPEAAGGKVEVNALAPGGLPLRKAPDPGKKPNTFKLDFPIKPGDSRVDLTWSMPFTSPGTFEEPVLTRGGLTRVVAPPGVTLTGDLDALGQEPQTQAMVYQVKSANVKVEVTGTGSFRDPSADQQQQGGAGQPTLGMNLPKIYGLASGSADMTTAALAVKWLLASVLGMLAVGFIILYRRGNPIVPQTFSTKESPVESGFAKDRAKESKDARGRR